MFDNLTTTEKSELLVAEQAKYESYKAMNLSLDMSRGKPCSEQLDISMPLLDILTSKSTIKGAMDYRNYGILDGIKELKGIFMDLLDLTAEEIIVAGNSSLNLMYDSIQRSMQFGIMGGEPFNKQGKIKWICPVPGYDRHFGATEAFGIELISIAMTDEGPDMDAVSELIKDPSVKGMWCVPKYSNPQGITYSDETVKKLASMKPAAKDFRIYWDNAYMIHSLTGNKDKLLDILAEAKKAHNEDIVYMFGSTSKVTFPGSGVAFISGSVGNMADARKRMFDQTIGPDKINQYAHYLFFKNADGLQAHMDKHEKIIAPKFAKVIEILTAELTGIATWFNPKGGYFISCDLPEGTALETIKMVKDAGVIFTPAGSTFPYSIDPKDSNVRIAPTLPPIEELELAMKVYCCAAKICALKKSM
ncbi:MAG: aminotransferase class I/II-fold pyridoxal phosphate-dependent enzyme [Bacillota bacterium]